MALLALKVGKIPEELWKRSRGGYYCKACGEEVGLRLSSQELLRREPETQILCMECALPQLEADKEVEIRWLPGQVREIIEELLRRRRN